LAGLIEHAERTGQLRALDTRLLAAARRFAPRVLAVLGN
jgi:hypothetical protein